MARAARVNGTRRARVARRNARANRDAIDDEVSSRCIASRIAHFHTFVNRPVSIDRFVVVLARLGCFPARIPHRDARRVAVGRARMRARAPAHVFDRAFYAKIAGVSFIVGAARGFMLATDFYPKVLHRRSVDASGKDARRVSATRGARVRERRFQNCL